MKCKGRGRKFPFADLKYYASIHLEELAGEKYEKSSVNVWMWILDLHAEEH